ncbi:hypothetical protein Lser_V15G26010 [Lactuca serriola]
MGFPVKKPMAMVLLLTIFLLISYSYAQGGYSGDPIYKSDPFPGSGSGGQYPTPP